MTESMSGPVQVLLTGATGFVGGYLLYEILEQYPEAQVICLVRKDKNSINSNLKSLNLWKDSYRNRITDLKGDLKLPMLGLSNDEFDVLAKKINLIFHCGANVNFTLPYAALKQENVDCTRDLLRLATGQRPIPFHYISTYSTALNQSLTESVTIEEKAPPEKYQGLFIGYSQSKWVAEKIAQLAIEKGYPVFIHRLGMIFGSSVDGVYNQKDFVNRLILASLSMGIYPELNTLVDVSPVDFATRSVVKISQNPSLDNHVFHIMNDKLIPWDNLFKLLDQRLKKVNARQWMQVYVNSGLTLLDGFAMLMKHPQFDIEHFGIGINTSYDVKNRKKALGDDIFPPKLDAQLAENLMKGFRKDVLKPLYQSPSDKTLAIIKSVHQNKEPVFLQSFISDKAVQAAYLLNEWINLKTKRPKTFNTFFSNTYFESFDGAVKIARHFQRVSKRSATGTILVHGLSNLESYVHPKVEDGQLDLRPGIAFSTDIDKTLSMLRQTDVDALVLAADSDVLIWETLTSQCREKNIVVIGDCSTLCIHQLSGEKLGEADAWIFGENISENQLPSGALSVDSRLFKVWNTANTCLLHTTTFGGNRMSMSVVVETLLSSIKNSNYPKMKELGTTLKSIETNRKVKGTYYKKYINKGLGTLLQLVGMDKKVIKASGSLLSIHNDNKPARQTIDALGSYGSCLRGHHAEGVNSVLSEFDPAKNYWAELSALLHQLCGLPVGFPAVSGATAIDIALTIGLLATFPKKHVIALKGGFSGKTLLALTGTQKDKYRRPFGALYAHVTYIDPFSESGIQSLEKTLSVQDVGIILLETIQGEGGVKTIPLPFLEKVYELKIQYGYLILIDEIQTGLFRTGRSFSFKDKVPTPDIVTIGKGLSDMMMPMAAAMVSESVYKQASARNKSIVDQYLVQYKNQLGSALSINGIQYARVHHLDQRAGKMGELLKKELTQIANSTSLIKEVRGDGLMLGIELNSHVFPFNMPFIKQHFSALFAAKCLSGSPSALLAYTLNNPETVRLAPPLTVSETEINSIVESIRTTVQSGPLGILMSLLKT